VKRAGADVEALYRKHAPGAFRRARCILRSDADAHEVVHDLYVWLLERPEQYAEHADLTGYMYKAVTHACLNRLRNQRTRSRLLQEESALSRLGPAATASLQPEESAALLSELARMPDTLASVAIYYYVDGMTHDEIALLLDCSPRHVGSLVARLQGWSLRECTS